MLGMHAYLSAHPWDARGIVDGELLANEGVMVTRAVLAAFEAYGLRRDDAIRTYRAERT